MDSDLTTCILKRDALGRVTLPRDKRVALLDEFERSGLPASGFARAAGINYQTFACWVQQRRHERGEYAKSPLPTSAALRLMEVVAEAMPTMLGEAPQATSSTSAASCRAPLELLLPGGARLLLHDVHQAELAAHLLRHLNPASSLPC